MGKKTNLKTLLSAALILLGFGCATALGEVIYVDDDADPCGDGLSWGTAYKYLQDALDDAVTDDEIWVAEGTYKPDQDEGGNVTPGARTATFQLINGVALTGGYAGLGEPDPNERDVELYETILSGDLLGNDGPGVWENNDENSYHVVTSIGTVPNTILDGFTITAGKDETGAEFGGGGIYNSGSPTIRNCTFSGNYALGFYSGGGMVSGWGSPALTNCTFSGNSGGGGMYNYYNSNPTVTNCTFSGNYGSGMVNYKTYFAPSPPIVTNCTFSGNTDGGMVNASSSPIVTNCTFSGNVGDGISNGSSGGGGRHPMVINCTFNGNSRGMGNYDSSPTVTNCTFSGNSWDGMYNQKSSPLVSNCTFSGDYYGVTECGSSSTLINCTFSGNWGSAVLSDCPGWPHGHGLTSDIEIANSILRAGVEGVIQGFGGSSTATITYSNVQGGWPGEGNIDADPCFVELGYWYPNGVWVNGDYHLMPTSPCIDAGNNISVPNDIADLDNDGNTVEPVPWDLDGRDRFTDGDCNDTVIVDMGAYEFTSAYFGDFNGSCDVDFADYSILADYWLTDELLVDIAPTPAGDGIVDERDLDVLCDNWLFGK